MRPTFASHPPQHPGVGPLLPQPAAAPVPVPVPSSSSSSSSSSSDEVSTCNEDDDVSNTPLIGQMPAAGPHPQPNPHAANQQHIQQQREVQMQHQAALRRVRKPTDFDLPEGIEDWDPIIAELCGQYKALQAAERKLDTIMAAKRLQMQDRYNKPERRERTLRIWINNTVANQPWQQPPFTAETFDFDTMGEEPTYKVKFLAALQPDPLGGDDSDEEVEEKDEDEKDAELVSHFFKRICVDVERPADDPLQINLFDWKKAEAPRTFDHFTMERKGDETFTIVISLYRDEKPERFRLSQALEATLDMEEASRAEVLQYMWEYIKWANLQDDDEKRRIRCDHNLKAVFGVDYVYFPQLAERIIPHLHPLEPYKLRYTVHIDKEYDGIQTVYDVQVAVDDPICRKIWKMTHSPKHLEELRKIEEINDKLAIQIQKCHRCKARRDFFYEFSMDPVGFTKKWTESQKRDLQIMLGDTRENIVNAMDFEKGGEDGIWGSDAVREAVRGKLGRDPQA